MDLYDTYIICPISKKVAGKIGRDADLRCRESLHVTVLECGSLTAQELVCVTNLCAMLARRLQPVRAEIAGPGIFTNGGELIRVHLVSAPGLEGWRSLFLGELAKRGITPPMRYGFIPHITVGTLPHGSQYTLTGLEEAFPRWIMDGFSLSYTPQGVEKFTVLDFPLSP